VHPCAASPHVHPAGPEYWQICKSLKD